MLFRVVGSDDESKRICSGRHHGASTHGRATVENLLDGGGGPAVVDLHPAALDGGW